MSWLPRLCLTLLTRFPNMHRSLVLLAEKQAKRASKQNLAVDERVPGAVTATSSADSHHDQVAVIPALQVQNHTNLQHDRTTHTSVDRVAAASSQCTIGQDLAVPPSMPSPESCAAVTRKVSTTVSVDVDTVAACNDGKHADGVGCASMADNGDDGVATSAPRDITQLGCRTRESRRDVAPTEAHEIPERSAVVMEARDGGLECYSMRSRDGTASTKRKRPLPSHSEAAGSNDTAAPSSGHHGGGVLTTKCIAHGRHATHDTGAPVSSVPDSPSDGADDTVTMSTKIASPPVRGGYRTSRTCCECGGVHTPSWYV